MKLDSRVDALYQLPIDQFTEQRNALAKELSGASRKQVKFLAKPPLPIWAVNQLFWKDRPTHNALIDASERLRAAHRSALSGHKADIRKPEQLHRAALENAVAKTVGLLEQSHGSVSDAARETIRKALGALPNDEEPGRLTRVPEAAGFSLLTGIKPRTVEPERPSRKVAEEHRPSAKGATRANAEQARAERRREERAARAREEAVAIAERDLRRARKAAEQARFRVQTLASELERARESEEKLAGQVSSAEQKLTSLRGS